MHQPMQGARRHTLAERNRRHGNSPAARGECPMCNMEPEAGWIEMPNNGPIVPCNLCNPKGEKPRPTE